jgi:ATP-binding cassette subfamily B protein
VPQEPFLFHGSIGDNIRFSRPDATHNEVMAACEAVGIDDMIERLPNGLDTPCHERGSSLSSGERQLLALARAFLAQPRVLVLDEATSNVDQKSESRIESALDNLLGGRTAIIIAHRLATARRADRIAVINDKGILEMGSHDELLAQRGYYAGMYATWEQQQGH